MEEIKSVVTGRPRDCAMCKLVGGVGLTGIGLYVGKSALGMKSNYAKGLYLTGACGAVILGIARLFDLPPFDSFHRESKHNEK